MLYTMYRRMGEKFHFCLHLLVNVNRHNLKYDVFHEYTQSRQKLSNFVLVLSNFLSDEFLYINIRKAIIMSEQKLYMPSQTFIENAEIKDYQSLYDYSIENGKPSQEPTFDVSIKSNDEDEKCNTKVAN